MIRDLNANDFLYILAAARWTIALSLIAIVSGGLLGLVVMLARLSRSRIMRSVFMAYIQFFQATPLLMQACATGQHIADAILTCRKAGTEQQEFLVIKFNDLLISSYQTGGSGHSDVVPTDQISFNFSKIAVDYKPQKADGSLGGSVQAGYDLKLNAKI